MAHVVVTGSYNQDLIFHTTCFPRSGETRLGELQLGPGGKGFNQAVASKRLGMETLFIGAVGDDALAQGVRDFAAREGIITALEVHHDAATGAASIMLNREGENCIVVALGANAKLSPAHVRQSWLEHARDARVALVQMETNRAAALKALQLARNQSCICIFNPAPIDSDIDTELLKAADVITPNEREFASLLKRFGDHTIESDVANLTDSDLDQLSRSLGIATVIITLGARGVFVSHADNPSDNSPRFYRLPALSGITPVDTTGAGDAFNGALAVALAREPDKFQDAVRFATIAAGLSTQCSGAATAMPTLDDVLALVS